MTDQAGLAPRRAAWEVLQQVADGRPFDLALDAALDPLTGADRRLAHELAAGTLRAAAVLDRELAPFVPRGLDSVALPIRDLLRIGAYQMMGLDRIPSHAAVSTSVALARATGHSQASGFVNAVLRKVALGAPKIVPGRGTHPGWLVNRWTLRFGAEDTAELLAWNDTRPSLAIQPARWTLEQLRTALTEAGIPVDDAPFGAGLLPEATRPAELPGFVEGGFIVQDPAQHLVVRFFDLPPGAVVYDACAAPGGKTIQLGLRAGLVVAGEPRRERIHRLKENLARAGSGREFPIIADASAPPVRPLDAVVLDVPCLGTGVLARHPDARWRVSPEALTRLASEAGQLLDAAADRVRPGGWLCFSTCSLEPEENEVQIEAFLARDDRFQRDPGPAPAGVVNSAGDLQLLPHRYGTDGAYATRLKRAG
jgi:16S rRNA (cytosine967-C5)-methyltransferase